MDVTITRHTLDIANLEKEIEELKKEIYSLKAYVTNLETTIILGPKSWEGGNK